MTRTRVAIVVAVIAVVGLIASIASSASPSSLGSAAPDVGSEVAVLEPMLGAGAGGWCLTTQAEPSICSVIGVSGSPIVGQSWQSGESTTHGFAVTRSGVAAVSVEGGQAIPTRADPYLPEGLRVVSVTYHAKLPVGHRPRFTALGVGGAVLPLPSGREEYLFRFPVPDRRWRRPAHVTSGACQLLVNDLNGVVAESGAVVTHVKGYSDPIGRPYLSCVNTRFAFAGAPETAAVLLDGAHPGSEPAPLPGMQPVPGHPGTFSDTSNIGPLAARRDGATWLVVSGGSMRARLELLDHLVVRRLLISSHA